jgi:asparagine synthase (glutamine-hydrolysing)
MGKKPLYYFRRGTILYFASEIKALLTIPGFQRRINLEALHHYLSFKHVPHPLSIFEGVSILPPAHLLIYRSGAEPEIRRYWELDFSEAEETATLPEEKLVDRLLTLLRKGVERRLVADVPIGFFLSGGIDSSLSTALAAELSAKPVKTFTLTYGGKSTTPGKEQDRRWARWVAEKYQTEHHEEAIEFANFPENIRRILTCFDEPFSGVVSTYFLAQTISRHVKVALTGDGADELFGSYLSHRLAFPLANQREFQRTGSADLIRPFEREPEYLARLAESDDWDWRYKLMVMTDEEKAALYSPDLALRMSAFSTHSRLRQDYASLTARDPLNRVLEAEFRTLFPDQVLTFADRLSMAHSLETRSPFLDTALVEMVAALPGHFKIRKGETKYLLKKAALRFFPQEMVLRPKEGFQMPVTEWVLGELEDYVRETLSPARLKRHGLFNVDEVERWIAALYQDRSRTHYSQVNKVMALIIFQEWYELYIH